MSSDAHSNTTETSGKWFWNHQVDQQRGLWVRSRDGISWIFQLNLGTLGNHGHILGSPKNHKGLSTLTLRCAYDKYFWNWSYSTGSDPTRLHVGSILPQGRVPGPAQGDPAALRHEEDQPPEPGAEEPDPAGLRGARHPHLRREPLRGVHVLLLRDPETPLHGDGVCGRYCGWGMWRYDIFMLWLYWPK